MGQKLREDKLGTLSHSSGIITMAASTSSPAWLTIGGQQYKVTSNLARTITSDVTLSANSNYYVYAVSVSGAPQLRISTNANSVGPAGFSSWRMVGNFLSNGSSAFGGFNSSDVALGYVSAANQMPVGTIVQSMLTETQFQALNGTAWVLAYGQSITGSVYADITGTSTAPDLRGRVIAGKDNMGGSAANRMTSGGSGVDGSTLGAVGGAETHALSTAQMPSHSHVTNQGPLSGGDGGSGGSAYLTLPGLGNISTTGSGATKMATDAVGSSAAHNNTQPTIVLNTFIKINY